MEPEQQKPEGLPAFVVDVHTGDVGVLHHFYFDDKALAEAAYAAASGALADRGARRNERPYTLTIEDVFGPAQLTADEVTSVRLIDRGQYEVRALGRPS